MGWLDKLGGKKRHKKKHGVGGEVLDEVGDALEGGCCLGGLLTFVVAGLSLVVAGFAGARALRGLKG